VSAACERLIALLDEREIVSLRGNPLERIAQHAAAPA
jgi:hypothetical protein